MLHASDRWRAGRPQSASIIQSKERFELSGGLERGITVPMFQLTVLGSGSAGNCSLLETPEGRLLVDAGLSARQITVRLAGLGIAPESLDGILLTHEHGDHARALPVLLRKYDVPVFTTPLTAEVLRQQPGLSGVEWRLFQPGDTLALAGLEVETFSVPHDAVDPLGFCFHHCSGRLGYATDLGFATRLVVERLRQVETLFVETNHDEKLLHEDERRPWAVKQRILSRHGHLSNRGAAELIRELLPAGRLCRVVFGHLSRDCNSPELAEGEIRSCLNGTTPELICATQGLPTPSLPVGERIPAGTWSS